MTAPAPCPICRKPQVAQYRPFCSRRCADVDLARWFRADYAVPGPELGTEDTALDEGDT